MSSKITSEIVFLSLTQSGAYFPSPNAWEDQVFCFLMLDQFFDGREKDCRDNQSDWDQDKPPPGLQF
jgi:hypothetical protein